MLINCPECELQVSDKAISCPHCGYPLKETEIKQKISKEADQDIKPKSKTTKHRRLPNGFGQISEIKNSNLRNRFRVMVTVSKTPEGKPISKILKPNGYFATYNDAYKALVEYNKNPYDLDSILDLKTLYEKWSKERYKKMTYNTARAYKAAWLYCSTLYDMRVMEIRSRHIKQCIEEGSYSKNGTTTFASAQIKNRMKILFNALFDYAVEYDITDKNYARAFKLSEDITKEIEENRVPHIAFDEKEIQVLWDNRDQSPYIDYVLFNCYSGWRPTEFCILLLSNVHLEEGYITGGIKTDAGKDRIVPIHPKVKEIVEREYKRAKEMKSSYLFNVYNQNNYFGSTKLSYERYRLVFRGVMESLCLNPEHKPHDTRKTFATLAKKYNMDEYALKRIIGHDIDDITEAIYTERSLDWYHEEMKKIK